MPKKRKLENKGNYVGNLTGKIQEQRLQDDGTRGSFSKSCQTRVRVVTFVETLGSHLRLHGIFVLALLLALLMRTMTDTLKL